MHSHRYGRRLHWILPFHGKFLRNSRYSNNIPRIDRTLEHQHATWLDDIIKVTKGNVEKHKVEVHEKMTELGQTGFRRNPEKCEFFKKKENELVGQKSNQHGIQPPQDKLDAITKISIPRRTRMT